MELRQVTVSAIGIKSVPLTDEIVVAVVAVVARGVRLISHKNWIVPCSIPMRVFTPYIPHLG